MEKKTGLTKNEGWQFGIRKTVPVKADIVWDFLFSEVGTALWLKDANREFSTFSTSSHIRTKWKLKKWTNEATLQMRIISNIGKSTIAFHIDQLLNEDQRAETQQYWSEILNEIILNLNKI
ncbi:hypothetical protein [Elizabethkingia anophelis]|uniref:hypothetical protein n=1 Tax=Elizabethkingia anophelis TaxID=1117645 RepID=UPI0004E3188E|nr:hypothetical protein [Elizabethkingia anophelis]KFC33226.1 hypothetical protein FF18_10975 [Elizabethkingia anophelis]MCT3734773.1 hypothetical protein [Elizabethkingia anophelis]MCT3786882.1 hypothetical protein [Elizabethkingia anophelis]MCW2464125.1 hypothetical protein [Elizabethkingia anophelis]MCW2467809.1 hypothetical protein [Elizabethkingia anophelis]